MGQFITKSLEWKTLQSEQSDKVYHILVESEENQRQLKNLLLNFDQHSQKFHSILNTEQAMETNPTNPEWDLSTNENIFEKLELEMLSVVNNEFYEFISQAEIRHIVRQMEQRRSVNLRYDCLFEAQKENGSLFFESKGDCMAYTLRDISNEVSKRAVSTSMCVIRSLKYFIYHFDLLKQYPEKRLHDLHSFIQANRDSLVKFSSNEAITHASLFLHCFRGTTKSASGMNSLYRFKFILYLNNLDHFLISNSMKEEKIEKEKVKNFKKKRPRLPPPSKGFMKSTESRMQKEVELREAKSPIPEELKNFSDYAGKPYVPGFSSSLVGWSQSPEVKDIHRQSVELSDINESLQTSSIRPKSAVTHRKKDLNISSRRRSIRSAQGNRSSISKHHFSITDSSNIFTGTTTPESPTEESKVGFPIIDPNDKVQKETNIQVSNIVKLLECEPGSLKSSAVLTALDAIKELDLDDLSIQHGILKAHALSSLLKLLSFSHEKIQIDASLILFTLSTNPHIQLAIGDEIGMDIMLSTFSSTQSIQTKINLARTVKNCCQRVQVREVFRISSGFQIFLDELEIIQSHHLNFSLVYEILSVLEVCTLSRKNQEAIHSDNGLRRLFAFVQKDMDSGPFDLRFPLVGIFGNCAKLCSNAIVMMKDEIIGFVIQLLLDEKLTEASDSNVAWVLRLSGALFHFLKHSETRQSVSSFIKAKKRLSLILHWATFYSQHSKIIENCIGILWKLTIEENEKYAAVIVKHKELLTIIAKVLRKRSIPDLQKNVDSMNLLHNLARSPTCRTHFVKHGLIELVCDVLSTSSLPGLLIPSMQTLEHLALIDQEIIFSHNGMDPLWRFATQKNYIEVQLAALRVLCNLVQGKDMVSRVVHDSDLMAPSLLCQSLISAAQSNHFDICGYIMRLLTSLCGEKISIPLIVEAEGIDACLQAVNASKSTFCIEEGFNLIVLLAQSHTQTGIRFVKGGIVPVLIKSLEQPQSDISFFKSLLHVFKILSKHQSVCKEVLESGSSNTLIELIETSHCIEIQHLAAQVLRNVRMKQESNNGDTTRV